MFQRTVSAQDGVLATLRAFAKSLLLVCILFAAL
jgi:hypothetical protein